MILPSRYHLVREWHLPTGRVSEPFVLDRHRRSLRPYAGSADARSEWGAVAEARDLDRAVERLRARVLDEPTALRQRRLVDRLVSRDRDMGRLSAFFGTGDMYPLLWLIDLTLSSISTTALNSNYVAGTSGAAMGGRFLTPVGGKTLNSVYFNVGTYTGTASAVNDINLELRPEASAGAATPNTSTLTESKSVDPASATGWIATTGWTSVLTALARNFVIVGDADGSGVNFANLRRSSTGNLYAVSGNQIPTRFGTFTTTGGWASGNSFTPASIKMVLGFSDGTAFGDPLTVDTAPASDTNRRGLAISSAGLVASLKIFGMLWTSANANCSGMEISQGTDPPGTTVDASTEILYSGTATRIGALTNGGAPYELQPGTAYHVVATFGGATSGGPQRMDVGTGEDATLRLAMPGGGRFSYARANGTTDWSNDLAGSLPAISLLVDGQIAASPGGGGGIRVAGHGGLAA